MSNPEPELLVLPDDEALQRRLEAVLTRAIRRQLWITFLDADDRETGIVVPVDDHPVRPDAEVPTHDLGVVPAAALLASRFAGIMREVGLAQIVLVWERRGGPVLRAPDRAWADAFAAALREEGVRVRAQFLLHDRGMRRIALDEPIAA